MGSLVRILQNDGVGGGLTGTGEVLTGSLPSSGGPNPFDLTLGLSDLPDVPAEPVHNPLELLNDPRAPFLSALRQGVRNTTGRPDYDPMQILNGYKCANTQAVLKRLDELAEKVGKMADINRRAVALNGAKELLSRPVLNLATAVADQRFGDADQHAPEVDRLMKMVASMAGLNVSEGRDR